MNEATATSSAFSSGRLLCACALACVAACGTGPAAIESPRIERNVARLDVGEDALRVKVDTVRDRIWVVGIEHVDVYDRGTRRPIRRIALPRWMVARFVCGPDIAFDRAGTALIAHNFEPRLWRIDADTFDLKEYAIRLAGKEHLDVGFGRLAFASDGALYALTSSGSLRWQIDLESNSAASVGAEAPVVDDCPLQ